MNSALVIGRNDLRVFLRARLSWVWLFVVPLAFVYFMGFANRGPGDPANPRPPVQVENHDSGLLSQVLLEELGAQGIRVVDPAQGGAARGLRIPPDFTERVLRHEPVRVEFFQLEGSGAGEAALIELRLVRAIVALNSHLIELITTQGEAALTNAAAWEALRARENPVRLEARFAGRQPVPTGFSFSLPGILVMYLMMNLTVFGGAALVAERRNGVLRRCRAQGLRRGELVAGKLCGLLLLAAVQIAFLLLVGRLVFAVPLGANLPAVLVTLLVFAWVAAALGVLAGSTVASEDRVVGLCVLASLLMAALGGCWWPLELAPAWLRTAAHALPTGWAMDALHQLISFGAGWAAVVKPLSVLAAFGAAFTWLATRAFRV
jgi:ABC-type multidrug transport system permease subunit